MKKLIVIALLLFASSLFAATESEIYNAIHDSKPTVIMIDYDVKLGYVQVTLKSGTQNNYISQHTKSYIKLWTTRLRHLRRDDIIEQLYDDGVITTKDSKKADKAIKVIRKMKQLIEKDFLFAIPPQYPHVNEYIDELTAYKLSMTR